jgi:Heterokaryon incompatibility protein (HET)
VRTSHRCWSAMAVPPNRIKSFQTGDSQKTFDSGDNVRERSGNAVRERFRGIVEAVPKRGSYIYKPINPLHEIRILRILHGTGDDPLNCKLYKSALTPTRDGPTSSERRPYIALSYWWGLENENANNVISIHSDTGGRDAIQQSHRRGTFYIRRNLKAALQRLRDSSEDVDIWVDAICINQEDKAEKNAQVSRMHEIYTQAESVSIWLGQGRPEARETFEFLKEILDLHKLDEYVNDYRNETARKWKLIIDLMSNRWFSRRWVIQELAYSREAYVIWGNEGMEWSNFADAISLFMINYKIIRRKYSNHPELNTPLDAHALGPNTMVHAMTNLFRRSQDGRIRQRLIPLEILVSSMLTGLEASEPCDTVYAVRTLAKDYHLAETGRGEDPRLSPNYDKRLFDVYADFISYCIEKSKSLDILCRYWALPPTLRIKDRLESREKERLPTWIPLIKFSAFGEPEGRMGGRVNGDSFVGSLERKGRQTYNASSGLPPHETFGMLGPPAGPSQNQPASPKYNGTLSVRGFRLGTIVEVSERVAGKGVIPLEALEMGGWHHDLPKTQQDLPDQLWRTLVADRGPDGSSTPGWYRRACLECLQHTNRSGELDIEEVMKRSRMPSTMTTFLERVQCIVWRRRFFKIQYHPPLPAGEERDELLFALGPPDTRTSNIVCILFGCSVPVVLCKKGDGEPNDYEFLGECYVHGMMDGEAIPDPPPEYPYEEGTMYETYNLK